jgi:energy-coupling factor transport system ATP-binding protein
MLAVSVIYALLARYPLKKPLHAYLKLLPWFILFALIQFFFFSTAADTSEILFQWNWLVITKSKVFVVIRTFLRAPAIIISLGCFVYTTDERQILDGLSALLTPLALIKIPVRYFVLTVGIVFRFIPLLLDELSGIIKTQLVRGAFGKARGLGKIKIMLPLFVPLILQTFRKAQYLADALTARYFN